MQNLHNLFCFISVNCASTAEFSANSFHSMKLNCQIFIFCFKSSRILKNSQRRHRFQSFVLVKVCYIFITARIFGETTCHNNTFKCFYVYFYIPSLSVRIYEFRFNSEIDSIVFLFAHILCTTYLTLSAAADQRLFDIESFLSKFATSETCY